MLCRVTVMPQNRNIEAAAGENLLQVLRSAGFPVNAVCGGNGSCGKCKVWVDGTEVLACKTSLQRDITVTLPAQETGVEVSHPQNTCAHTLLAFDIGTTTVAGYLLDEKTGQELATGSFLNPQIAYGADVISRIHLALQGEMETLTQLVRKCLTDMTQSLCRQAGADPRQIQTVSIVANPAMQQLFLGILPENLVTPPFRPVLTKAQITSAKEYLPLCEQASLIIVPNISGFVGADTIGCLLASGMDTAEEMTLLIDIGTNGEMVLGNKHRMVACSTAAGPALEGAGISCGMRAAPGAIDHIWQTDHGPAYSVIGDQRAIGICGSGLVDAVAAALNGDLINHRGRIENETHTLPLADSLALTQADIRQLQQAKGAISAGITLMAEHLGISLQEIQRVYLAGAFGSFLNPASACRIGLLPLCLEEKIQVLGNAAGTGAKLLARQESALSRCQQLCDFVEHLDLSTAPGFRRQFADAMHFLPGIRYWCEKAKALGFTEAAPLSVQTLAPRADVRAMCAQDKCHAYGKNWTCPPHCGTLSECEEEIRSFSRGILLQTVGTLEKTVDTKAYRLTENRHLSQLHALAEAMSPAFPQRLVLGSGGCRICPQCAWPEPCRFPEKACSSMEGYGLFVTQICRDNGLAYHHGERTVTYTACILF